MERLIEELVVEAEVAGERQYDMVVLEPGQPVDHETKRHSVHARRGGRADREGERAEHPWQHHLFAGRDDAVFREPVDSDARFDERA